MNKNSTKGRFFVWEGIDGSGKTTQINAVAERLKELGYPVVQSREPGGTLFAEKIRDLLKGKWIEPLSVKTQLLLMFASREQHLNGLIRPALAEGKLVLVDRFVNSSWCYQIAMTGASDEEQELFFNLVMSIVGDTTPDLTFVLDVDDAVSRERAHAHGGADAIEHWDKMSDDKRQILNATVRSFGEMPKHVLVDANRPVNDIRDDIVNQIIQLIEGND